MNALYRPGPIQGGMIDDFIERKWGRKKIEYELPELETMLKETCGVIVYQEQVMQIANRLAGYSLGEADLLRRAMGKKDAEEMAKQRERFVKGALDRGFPQKKVEKIFDLMEQFAGYGFNKSHSAAYALLAYHTAYLKTHYPVEFMAALLTSVSGSTDDVVKYINECREMGIAVEPPDVNVSDAYFTPHGEAIRFGLAAVKNVGHNAIESIVVGAQRDRRVQVDLPVLRESRPAPAEQARDRVAVKSGAMDAMGRRSQLMAVIDTRHGARAEIAARRRHGTARPVRRVCAGGRTAQTEKPLPNIPDWDEHQRLSAEKEILGFFITGHPLEKYRDKLLDFSALTTRRSCATEVLDRQGRSSGRRHPQGRARVEVEEGRSLRPGTTRGHERLGRHPVLFGVVQAADGKAEAGCAGAGEGKRARGRGIECEADDQRHYSAGAGASPNCRAACESRSRWRQLQPAPSMRCTRSARERKGEAKVLFDLERKGDFTVVMEVEGYNVLPDRSFINRVEELCGRGSVRIID